MDANEPDEGAVAGLAHQSDDPVWPDAAVGLVISVDADYHIGTQHPAPARVFGETVKASERIRRDRGLDPLDRIPIVVVMGWLDQHQWKRVGMLRV